MVEIAQSDVTQRIFGENSIRNPKNGNIFITMDKNERRFFTTVYRLAQQSVEGFAFWKELLPHLKLRRAKYWDAVTFNEELLRIIITNTKRSFVVTTFILC